MNLLQRFFKIAPYTTVGGTIISLSIAQIEAQELYRRNIDEELYYKTLYGGRDFRIIETLGEGIMYGYFFPSFPIYFYYEYLKYEKLQKMTPENTKQILNSMDPYSEKLFGIKIFKK